MRITDINLQGYGEFLEAPRAFRCTQYHLPMAWDYVYANGNMLLAPVLEYRVRHWLRCHSSSTDTIAAGQPDCTTPL